MSKTTCTRWAYIINNFLFLWFPNVTSDWEYFPCFAGGETEKFTSAYYSQSPALTPRRSSLVRPSFSSSYDASAPLGFEPEGSCGTTTMEGESPPACLRWAKNLHNLLHDPEGLELFRQYLDQEGKPYVNPLNFWFACEGLKRQRDSTQIYELIKLIHGRWGYSAFETSANIKIWFWYFNKRRKQKF